MVWQSRRNRIIFKIIMVFAINNALAEQPSQNNEDLFAEPIPNYFSTPSTTESREFTNLIKEQVPLSAEEQAELNYTLAMTALERHQEIEATTLFQHALQIYPRHHKARIQLIQLYQKIGWYTETEKLLLTGLDLVPEHADFIKNLALLYQQQGQMRKSLAILLTMPNSYCNQIDYLALLALAYLHSEQPDIATKYYQQLLTFDKTNAVWWLGLGIAQQANKNYQLALKSFMQAKNLGRFNPEILDYINYNIQQISKIG